jgi:hypothetical protein
MNRGILQLSPELLLAWLQFSGGKIIDIRVNNWNRNGAIEMIIDHPEMPEVKEGDCLQNINPVYIHKIGKTGKILKVTR